MEVSLSQETMEMLSTMIADKLSSAKTEKLVGIKNIIKSHQYTGRNHIPLGE